MVINWTPSLGQGIPDTTKLPNSVAKEVVKDLLVGDAAKKKVDTLTNIITNKDSIIAKKDTIIGLKDQQLKIYEGVRKSQDNIIMKQFLYGEKLERQLKWSKTKTTVTQVVLLLVTGLLISKL